MKNLLDTKRLDGLMQGFGQEKATSAKVAQDNFLYDEALWASTLENMPQNDKSVETHPCQSVDNSTNIIPQTTSSDNAPTQQKHAVKPISGGYAPVVNATETKSSLVCMADIEPKIISWLWNPFIPLGKITVIRGDPGQGKTTMCLTLAAIVSQGWAFPNEAQLTATEQGNVLFITAEDDLNDTIAPRLIAAKADMSRIFSYKESATDTLTFTSPQFEALLKESNPRLVIVDPIQAFLGTTVDGHRANEIRPVMSHLRSLAEKYNCAVVLIEHMNKNMGGKGLYRGLGSIDITAAARSVIMLGSNPNDEKDKGICHIKSNCGAMGKVVGFSIGNDGIVWNPHTLLTADMIQGYVKSNSDKGDSALDEAKAFLRESLQGSRQLAKDVTITAKQYSITDSTLRRAREDLGVITEREGFGKSGSVYWKLPFQMVTDVTPKEQMNLDTIFQ